VSFLVFVYVCVSVCVCVCVDFDCGVCVWVVCGLKFVCL